MRFSRMLECAFRVFSGGVCRSVVFFGVLVRLACISVVVRRSVRCVVIVISLCAYVGLFLPICRAWGFVPVCDVAVVSGVSVCSAWDKL